MGLDEDARILVYREVSHEPTLVLEGVQLERHFEEQDIKMGTVLVFQQPVEWRTGSQLESVPLFPTAREYM